VRDYDGSEYPDAEPASAFAGIPDGFQRLWTPHRIAYIERGGASPGDECVFCTAPTLSDEQALIVHRGESAYVILNLFPYNPGHLLVVPFRHVAGYDEASSSESAEIAALTQTSMRVLTKTAHCDGFNVGMNQGAIAGAGIAAHLHQHVVPRWGADSNFFPIIARTKALPRLLGEVRDELAGAWPGASGHSS
jgi:ATP adenylyltransferase